MWSGALAAVQLLDADRVDELLGQTQALRGRWIDAVRTISRAAATALRGDQDAATRDAVIALEEWRAMNLPLDHAHAVTAVARVLPRALIPAADLDGAREFLASIGANGLLDLLDTALELAPIA